MSHKKLLHKHKQKTKKTQKIDKKIITESKRCFSTKLFPPFVIQHNFFFIVSRNFFLNIFDFRCISNEII